MIMSMENYSVFLPIRGTIWVIYNLERIVNKVFMVMLCGTVINLWEIVWNPSKNYVLNVKCHIINYLNKNVNLNDNLKPVTFKWYEKLNVAIRLTKRIWGMGHSPIQRSATDFPMYLVEILQWILILIKLFRFKIVLH